MLTRKDLKMKGKASFKANYWRSVLVAVLVLLAIGGGSAYSAGRTSTSPDFVMAVQGPDAVHVINVLTGLALVFLSVIGVVVILIKILLLNPLEISCQNFFMANGERTVKLDALEKGFTPKYKRNVGAILLRDVYLVLWTLLFIIPGIIKYYSYAMVPYILADDEDISPKEAITLSRKMMDGRKWEFFVLEISFFWWWLLSMVTLGIAGVFYVHPYYFSTKAQFYLALREEFQKK